MQNLKFHTATGYIAVFVATLLSTAYSILSIVYSHGGESYMKKEVIIQNSQFVILPTIILGLICSFLFFENQQSECILTKKKKVVFLSLAMALILPSFIWSDILLDDIGFQDFTPKSFDNWWIVLIQKQVYFFIVAIYAYIIHLIGISILFNWNADKKYLPKHISLILIFLLAFCLYHLIFMYCVTSWHAFSDGRIQGYNAPLHAWEIRFYTFFWSNCNKFFLQSGGIALIPSLLITWAVNKNYSHKLQ